MKLATRYSSPPGLSKIERAVQELRQPVVIVRQTAHSGSDAKHLARIAELEKQLASVKALAHAKDRVENLTTPKHHIVVTSSNVYVADGLDLSAYAKVKLPWYQRLKHWAMGE